VIGWTVSALRAPGSIEEMAEKTDYSPVIEGSGEAEKRRERRKWGALLGGAHLFWIYALILAGIIAVLYYGFR
jgi:hypothetical protein